MKILFDFMPKVESKISHDLGREEALRRIKDSCDWAHGVSDLQEIWLGNVMSFSASVQGVKIKGKIEVTEDTLKFAGNIPLIAVPFKSWIPNILRNSLKQRRSADEVIVTDSNEPLLFYLHIPKAGGTTLGEFIYNQCRNPGENDDGLIKNGVFFTADGFFREDSAVHSDAMQNLFSKKSLRAVMGHFAFGIHQYAERPFRYITLLRDPVKRVISLYHFLKLEDQMDLEEFANSAPFREIDNDQTRRIAGVNPEMGKCSENDLETAKNNLRQHFAVVGTTERFDETLVLLKHTLNWSKEVSSYPRNVSQKKMDAFSDSSIEAVRRRNLFDIELHRFAGQIMDEMIAGLGDIFSESLKKQRLLNSLEK